MSGLILIQIAPAWHTHYAGATFGALALRGVTNPKRHPALSAAATALETELRQAFGGLDQATLRATPPIPAYAAYYKRFGQRYHVARQLESVVHQDKPLPGVAALVEAMFMAELRNLVLTAGHDLDAIAAPVQLAIGSGSEQYQTLAGREATVKAGDMFTADKRGVLSAIITGPAGYAPIAPETTNVLFIAYAPPGVPADVMDRHLESLEANVRLIAPDGERAFALVAVAQASEG